MKYFKNVYQEIIYLLILGLVAPRFCFAGLFSTEGKEALTSQTGSFYNEVSDIETSASAIDLYATVFSLFLGFLGIIFLVLIIGAGYSWMTAQGNEEKITKSKDTFKTAIIGLIIILSAYAITYFVFSSLPKTTG